VKNTNTYVARCSHLADAVHPEYPLERMCLHQYEPFQLTFARHAMQILPEREDGAYEATHHGLVLRGETESALEPPVRVLEDYYGSQIQVGPPTIRYLRTKELEAPYMGVRVLSPSQYFEAIKADLLARGAAIVDSEVTRHFGVIRATAPLEKLLGYAANLAAMTGGKAREVMWLSHYEPVPMSE
jgi:translation elongation factor EF-G